MLSVKVEKEIKQEFVNRLKKIDPQIQYIDIIMLKEKVEKELGLRTLFIDLPTDL